MSRQPHRPRKQAVWLGTSMGSDIGTPFFDIRTPFSYQQHLPLLYALFLFAYVHFSHYTALPLTLYIARHKPLVRSIMAYRMYRDMFFYRQHSINPSTPVSSSESIYRYTAPLPSHYSAPESSTATILSTSMNAFEFSNQFPPLHSKIFKTKEEALAYAPNHARQHRYGLTTRRSGN